MAPVITRQTKPKVAKNTPRIQKKATRIMPPRLAKMNVNYYNKKQKEKKTQGNDKKNVAVATASPFINKDIKLNDKSATLIKKDSNSPRKRSIDEVSQPVSTSNKKQKNTNENAHKEDGKEDLKMDHSLYIDDTIQKMFESELAVSVNTNIINKNFVLLDRYMNASPGFSWTGRSRVLGEIMIIHGQMERKFPQSTVFIAANILDRFFSVYLNNWVNLRLYGFTAYMIACKHELDQESFSLNFYSKILGYSANDLARVERIILCALKYKVNHLSPIDFLRYVCSGVDHHPAGVRDYAMYLLEVCYVDPTLTSVCNSLRASACVFLARLLSGEADCWTGNLKYISRYNFDDDLLPVVNKLIDYLMDTENQNKAVYQKWSDKKRGNISESVYLKVYEIVNE